MNRHEYIQKILDTFGKIEPDEIVFKNEEDKKSFQGRVGDAIDKIENFESFTKQQARKEFAEELKKDFVTQGWDVFVDGAFVEFIDKKLKQMEEKS